MSSNAVRVLHILPSMHGYGAERQVMQLLPHLESPETTAGLLTVYTPTEEERCSAAFPVADACRHGRRDVTFVSRLVERINAFEPDIVHTHTHVGKYWGRFAAVASGVRSIVHTEHNPCDPRRSPLDWIADRALNPYTMRCITFFPEQRDMLAKTDGINPQKITIIPNGLAFEQMPVYERSHAREVLQLADDRFAVILVGRMEFQKNHALALRALASVPAELRRRITLLFAGSGILEPELRALAASLNLGEAVDFLGYRSDVPRLLSGADALLMTSHFEGMPLALLEAMHAGVPIVTTPWLGARTMLGDGAYGTIAASWEPADVAAEICRSLAQPDAVRRRAQDARRHVRAEFTLEKMARRHHELYRELNARKGFAA